MSQIISFQNTTELEKIVNRRLNFIFYLLVTLFWTGQIWASVDVFVTRGKENALQHFFNHPMAGAKFLYPFGLVIILLALYIFIQFRPFFVRDRFYRRFFYLSLLVGIISLANPNNNLASMKFTAIRPAIFYFVYLFFLYVFTYIQKDVIAILLRKIFKIGLLLATARAIHSLVMLIIGKGMVWQGRMVTISTGDTLLLMALFQIITFALYLDQKKIYRLVLSALFLLILILSYRRSALILSLLVTAVLFTYYFHFTRGFSKKVVRIISVIYIIIGSLFILQFFPKSKLYDYVNRYTGAFSFFTAPEKSRSVHGDSGHMEQSIVTTMTFLDNLDRFWGRGYVGRQGYYVEGQSTAIHNSFVRVWAYFGLYMTLYLLFILWLMLRYSIKFWKKNKIPVNQHPIYIKSAIIFYLAAYFMMGWFNGTSITNFLQYYTQFALLMLIFKIDYDNITSLFWEKFRYRLVWR